MPLVSGQATVGTAGTVIFIVPPGEGVVTINSGTASMATVYLGFGSGTATTGDGYVLDPGRALTFATYASSSGAAVTATGGGSPCTLSWLITRPG
jgi:hypothetical protein